MKELETGVEISVEMAEQLISIIKKQQKEIESYENMIKQRFISKAKIRKKITELNNSMISGKEENIGLKINTLKELLEE